MTNETIQQMETLNRVVQISKKVIMKFGSSEYVADISVWNDEEMEKLKKKLLELALGS